MAATVLGNATPDHQGRPGDRRDAAWGSQVGREPATRSFNTVRCPHPAHREQRAAAAREAAARKERTGSETDSPNRARPGRAKPVATEADRPVSVLDRRQGEAAPRSRTSTGRPYLTAG